MVKVLADKYLYRIKEFLPDDINLTLFDPQKPLKKVPDGTDALLIRTTIKVTPDSPPSLPSTLQFVATASSGTDHVNLDWLAEKSITFADAAGCNARAVAEYVATALLIWADTRQVDPQKLKMGIIGVGHAGGETQKLLNELGIPTIPYDPPREKRDPQFTSASLMKVLDSDILTFHTPLTFETDYPTHHWLDESKLANQPFKLIINAARGGVVEEQALLKAYKNNGIKDYVLDVWENEPVFNDKIAERAFIHTPHIAGYSIQAKLRATEMVAVALCNHFDLQKPDSDISQSKKQVNIPKAVTSLPELLRYLHPVDDYHQKFSELIGKAAKEKGERFSRLRTEHPLRNEYHFLEFDNKKSDQFPVFNKNFSGKG